MADSGANKSATPPLTALIDRLPGRKMQFRPRGHCVSRLVITAVVVEGRSQSEVAREYGVSQGWISRLVARYRREGAAAFEPRSRRPQTSPAGYRSPPSI